MNRGGSASMSTIALTGAPNFRDLGGYRTADGRVVKRGVLFRSGESSRLTAADVAQLRRLSPRLIIDLRSNRESEGLEVRWPVTPDTRVIAANILADLRAGNRSLIELLTRDPSPRGASAMMETTYQVLPPVLSAPLLQLVRHVADDDMLPAIFHCAVGRDRAGITAALVLHALGVPRNLIIADYLRTNVCVDAAVIGEMTRTYLKRYGVELDEETIDILTYARIEHFHAAFRTIAVEYGSADEYLRAIGIDAPLVARLRERLLEAA
jgi:protein-tyrosine phosphatase